MYVAGIEIDLARFIVYRGYDKVKGLDTTGYRGLSLFFPSPPQALRFSYAYTYILSTKKRAVMYIALNTRSSGIMHARVC